MQSPESRNFSHCREVIRACLNIVEERGDTYVAIHKDEDTECLILAAGHEQDMYRTANELNSESVTGWHTLVLTDSSIIYMYRQCLWITDALGPDLLTEILCDCITEYKHGREHLAPCEPT